MTAYGIPVGPVTVEKPRCWKCNRLLAEKVTAPWVIRCTRCRATNQG